MSKNYSLWRWVAIAFLLLTGINAVVAGALFIVQPDGSAMGMSREYLQYSPFSSYLLPGIVLFTVNGILNLIAALMLLRKKKRAALFTMLQGVLLVGWIVVQVLMVREVNFLHYTMASIGCILAGSGWWMQRRTIP